MKKIITIIISIAPLFAFAQTDEPFTQYFSIGPTVGVNFSTLDIDGADSRVGLNAGGFFVYSFQEHFGISASLLYSSEGAKYKSAINDGVNISSFENELSLNYLRIPVTADVFFGQHGNMIRPKFMLGPELGFLLSAENEFEATITGPSGSATTESTADVKDDYAGMDFGAMLGAGLNIKLAEATWLNFDVGYHLGATDVRESGSGDDVKNRRVSVNAGVAFGI